MKVGLVDLQHSDAPSRFVETLRGTGFAVLTGHGIASQLLEALHGEWLAFFQSADKQAYRNTGADQFGFWPASVSETAVGASHPDLKEFFQAGPETPLPAAVAELVHIYRQQAWQLGKQLLAWVEQQLPEHCLAPGCLGLSERLSAAESLLRIVHYPPQDPMSPAGMRAAPHEDINLLTLLPVAQEPGLEVLDQQGGWHPVHGRAGQMIINAGDMLAEASGQYLRSTTHRVVNPDKAAQAARSRIAAPYFLAPAATTVLSERYTAGSYLRERLALIGLAPASAPAAPLP